MGAHMLWLFVSALLFGGAFISTGLIGHETARARAEAARADAEAAAAPVIAQGDAQAKALRAVQEQMMAAGDGQGAANATQQKLGAMMRLLEAASAQYGIEPDTLLQGLSGRRATHTPPADRE